MHSMRVTVGVLALSAACISAHAAVQIYGWQNTFTGSASTSLVQWRDPPSGGTIDIGDTTAFNISFDPAFSPQGQLWGTDGGTVFPIDLETGDVGVAVPITSHIFALNEFLTGLTFSPSGVMYAWSQNNSFTSGLYTINPVTGTAAVVNPDLGQPLFGMTFSPSGALYASNGFDLLQLNPANGAVIRDIGAFPDFVASLGWGPDGILRGLEPRSDLGTDLVAINPVTVQTTLLGSSAETIYGVATIPAPGAGLSLALVGVAARRRRR